MEPPVGVDGLFGGLGVVEVAPHDVVAPNHHFAGVAPRDLGPAGFDDPDVDVGDGPARRPGDHLGRIPPTAHRHGPGGLGQAVGGEDGLDAQVGPEPADQFDRHRRGSGDHQAQGGQFEGLAVRVVEDGLEDGGGAGQDRDLLPLDPLHHLVHVEDRLGDHGGPGHQTGQDAGLVPEGVEEGVDDQVPVPVPEPDDLGPGGEGPQGLTVGGHGPLGPTGGTRGEHQVREVPGGDRRGAAGGHVGRARPSLLQEDLPRHHGVALGRRGPRHVVVGAEDHHPLEVGDRLPRGHGLVQQGRIVGTEEALHGEEEPGARLAEDVRGLGPLEAGVEGHQQRPGTDRPQRRHHPLGAVGGPDGHPVPPLDAVGHDGAGGSGHLLGQLVEGESGGGPARTVHVDQRLGLAEAGGGILHQPGDGPPLEIPAGIGHI